jgi:hypothetical protein
MSSIVRRYLNLSWLSLEAHLGLRRSRVVGQEVDVYKLIGAWGDVKARF